MNVTLMLTCVLGVNFKILEYTSRAAQVFGFDKSSGSTEVPIVTGATAYGDLQSGETYILVFNESLFFGARLDHSLLNPNQIRHYGVPVWDNPFDTNRKVGM